MLIAQTGSNEMEEKTKKMWLTKDFFWLIEIYSLRLHLTSKDFVLILPQQVIASLFLDKPDEWPADLTHNVSTDFCYRVTEWLISITLPKLQQWSTKMFSSTCRIQEFEIDEFKLWKGRFSVSSSLFDTELLWWFFWNSVQWLNWFRLSNLCGRTL